MVENLGPVRLPSDTPDIQELISRTERTITVSASTVGQIERGIRTEAIAKVANAGAEFEAMQTSILSPAGPFIQTAQATICDTTRSLQSGAAATLASAEERLSAIKRLAGTGTGSAGSTDSGVDSTGISEPGSFSRRATVDDSASPLSLSRAVLDAEQLVLGETEDKRQSINPNPAEFPPGRWGVSKPPDAEPCGLLGRVCPPCEVELDEFICVFGRRPDQLAPADVISLLNPFGYNDTLNLLHTFNSLTLMNLRIIWQGGRIVKTDFFGGGSRGARCQPTFSLQDLIGAPLPLNCPIGGQFGRTDFDGDIVGETSFEEDDLNFEGNGDTGNGNGDEIDEGETEFEEENGDGETEKTCKCPVCKCEHSITVACPQCAQTGGIPGVTAPVQPVPITFPVFPRGISGGRPLPKPGGTKSSLLCQVDSYENISNLLRGLTGVDASKIINQILPTPQRILNAINPPLLQRPVFKMFLEVIYGTARQFILNNLQSAKTSGDLLGCFLGPGGTLTEIRLLLDLVALVAPSVANHIRQPFDYMFQKQCPVLFPDATQATQAWLAGELDDSLFQVWVEQNNHCFEPWKRFADSQRSRPVPAELITMKRRGIISDSDFDVQMRQMGYLFQSDVDNIFTATELRPGQQDLIRFMVRETDNKDVVKKFDLDVGFDPNRGDDIKAWQKDIGLSDKVLRHNWRAHWVIPGPQQLFEMFHRLPQIGGFGDEKKVRTDIEEALKIQDILPFWIERLMAVSFRPLSRVDLRRAFNIGAIDEATFTRGYREIGYSQENAEALTKFGKSLRNRAARNSMPVRKWRAFCISRQEAETELIDLVDDSSVARDILDDAECLMKPHPVVRQYRNLRVSRARAKDTITSFGVSDATAEKWLDLNQPDCLAFPTLKKYKLGLMTKADAIAELESCGFESVIATFHTDNTELDLKRDTINACTSGICKRFELGEFDEIQLRQALSNLGLVPEAIDREVGQCRCKMQSVGKQPSVSQLCQFLELGEISMQDFVQRLERLGYSDDDANKILAVCLDRIQTRDSRTKKQADKQAAAQQAREVRKAEQQRKASAQQMKARERALQVARKAKDRREVILLKAADKLAQKLGVPLSVIAPRVRTMNDRVRGEFFLTIDESIQAVAMGAEDKTLESFADFELRVMQIGQGFADLECSGGDLPSSDNGN